MTKFKVCVVPYCINNTVLTPNKLFITVPRDMKRRRKWFSAIGSGTGLQFRWNKTTDYIICEDHFKLEDDCTNWMQYKIMGTKITLKREVVPHIFSNSHAPESQLDSPTRKRKMEFLEEFSSGRRKKETRSVDDNYEVEEPHDSNCFLISPGPVEFAIIESNSGKYLVESRVDHLDFGVQVDIRDMKVSHKEVQTKCETVDVSLYVNLSSSCTTSESFTQDGSTDTSIIPTQTLETNDLS